MQSVQHTFFNHGQMLHAIIESNFVRFAQVLKQIRVSDRMEAIVQILPHIDRRAIGRFMREGFLETFT
jgi:hypothetical protein